MAKTKLTTVVIPNYNGIEYIKKCLDSLLLGSRVPEIIVVDNASSDGSRELVAENFPEAELIALPENTGFSAAVNEGIRKARSKYVFLLNNDAFVDEKCVEELENAMESAEGCFSICAKMINMKFPEKIDDAGDFYCALGWAFARGKDKPISRYNKPTRVFAACAGAAIYRRELFEKTGYFDEKHFAYLEDIDIGYRANILGFPNRYEPKALVYHAGSAVSGGRHNPFKVRLAARNSIYLIYKNMPLLQVFLNLPFLLPGYAVKFLFFLKKGMGGTYAKGVWEGFLLSFSGEGRKKKVTFRAKNLPRYLWIQWELLAGMVRHLIS